jgi:hypothetical protein
MSRRHQPEPKSYPAELRDVLERGQTGDATALPELKKAFDEHPALAGMLGDMPRLAFGVLLDAVAGPSLTAREAIGREAARLWEQLAGPDAPVLERLLAERVALTWMEVHHADTGLASALKTRPAESPQMQAAERRAHAAQARYLAAIEALATVRTLTQAGAPVLDSSESRSAPGRAERTQDRVVRENELVTVSA